MSAQHGRLSGRAFGFVPIYWNGEAFEGQNLLCEIALDICLWFVNTFMPHMLENGVPLLVDCQHPMHKMIESEKLAYFRCPDCGADNMPEDDDS